MSERIATPFFERSTEQTADIDLSLCTKAIDGDIEALTQLIR